MEAPRNITDISELNKENVYIRNKKELFEKINKIILKGHKSLQIVTDFDHTLTRHKMDNGKTVLTSFGMLKECPSVPQYYKDEDNRLAAIYKPMEIDPHMSTTDKISHMVDWYVAANGILKGLKFPRFELTEIGKKMVVCFRGGVKELLDWSEKQKVPVLVFSAGLGESVMAALKAADFLLPNVKVVSNFLEFDENDTIIGIRGEIIHTMNKNETAIKHTDYYEMVKERRNVILMGDNVGDAGMADGMDHCDVIIKVGFLGANDDANLHNYLNNYLNHFDVVLVNDSTMDVVNAILKYVL